jgi:hypothetical protein
MKSGMVVFMEEVAICQAAMNQNLMLMMLMDEEDSHQQRDRKSEFREKPRNTKRKFRHDDALHDHRFS